MSRIEDNKEKNECEDSLEQKLAKKSVEYSEIKDKYIRLAAEFDNSRKRWERDRLELLKWANSELLRDLLNVADEVEHAVRMAKEHSDSEKISQGLEMTYKNLLSFLKKNQVEPIITLDEKFDPHSHEIISSRETEGVDGHIILEEIQKGYLLDGKVLRTSKVVVGIPVENKTNIDPASGGI